MSLRGFFSRNIVSHSRRKNGKATSALAAQAEFLEDRVLLSVESPLLTDHGVIFENQNVLDQDVRFFAVNNPLYSNNNDVNPGRGPGNGLDVTLDGTQIFGNPPGTPVIPRLRLLELSPNLGPLAFNTNSNVGASINLSNLTLDELRIDGSTFMGNGRAGLIINLQNVQIGNLVILNSTFINNSNDGLCILASSSSVENLVLSGNNFSDNAPNAFSDGALIQFQNSRLGNVTISNNLFNGNGAHGIRIDLDSTSVSNLAFAGNSLRGNSLRGNGSGAFFDFQDSDVDGSVVGNLFGINTFTPNPANPNLTQGDGLRIQMRRSILPDGTTTPGLRNLVLDQVSGNTATGNGGSGINIDLGQNTTFRSDRITANQINNNGRSGLTLLARDTASAFDVTIGGEGNFDDQENNLDSNTFDGNRGAGIAITLDDTSSVIGNTSGRFRILNNTITNSLNDNLLNTEFAGEGIFVRARGSVSLVNGAARLLSSTIDGNMISGNASHGMSFDISEDSEVIGLLIGDEVGAIHPPNATERVEGDGFIFQNQVFRNSGNLVTGNGGNGLNFLRRDASITRNIRVIDNLFSGNDNGVRYTVRNLDNFVNTLNFSYNDVINNVGDAGLILETQIDAILTADLDRNVFAQNAGDGIRTLAFEGDDTDAETLGGVWTRNIAGRLLDEAGNVVFDGNGGRGININAVPQAATPFVGAVAPLIIGLLGTDDRGDSLGNMISFNGDDGVEINASGELELTNNQIIFNGQNNGTLNVHGDGKGIDINLNVNDGGFAGFTTRDSLNVLLRENIIQSNNGDGIEVLSRGTGGFTTFVTLRAFGNIVDLNLGRGVDVLTAGGFSESYILFGDGNFSDLQTRNNIRSNGLEGMYFVNSASPNQRQDVNASAAMDETGSVFFAPNTTIDIQGNDVRENGLPQNNAAQLNGSGVVIRVGSAGTYQNNEDVVPDREGFGFNVDLVGVGASNAAASFLNGVVNARINNNTFGGNRGVDVITESFTSTPPSGTGATWNNTQYNPNGFQADPLARLNFEFTNNIGNSVNLVRVGAFYNNAEAVFKSRQPAPAQTPGGPFPSATRFRTAQRLPDRPPGFENPTFGSGGLFDAFGTGGTFSSVTTANTQNPLRPIIINTDARSGFITNATNANPIVITSFNHGLATGEFVRITGVTGNTAANGVFQVVVDPTANPLNTFSLRDPITGANVAGNGAYTGGGTWTVVTQGNPITNVSGNGVSPITIASFFHGLTTGQQVTVTGVQGNTNANGTFTVTVIDQFSFSLNGTTGNGDWIPGTGAYFVESGGHGLFSGDTVQLTSFDFPTTPGFDLDGIYDVTVLSPSSFALNGTEGETNVSPFASGQFRQTAFSFTHFPGVGDSTFRIVEGNNFFPNGNDFSASTGEFEIFYAGGGPGHLGYTFDREVPGTFNFRNLTISNPIVGEGGTAEFVVTLDQAMDTPLTVFFTTQFGGSASDAVSAGAVTAADFDLTTGSVVIPAGMTSASVFIDTVDDDTFERDETFKLAVTGTLTTRIDPTTGFGVTESFATPLDAFGVATILDDDVTPSIAISDAGGFERGDGTTGQMTFTVTLSNASDSPIFVDFSTADFTANADVDYRFRQGTLTFAPGETVKTITIDILPDSLFGTPGSDVDQETLFLNLSSPVGATLADSQGVGTIFEPRFVRISDAAVDGDGDSGNTSLASFLITLTDAQGNPSFVPSGQSITVNFSTMNGTAIAGNDYVAASGTVVFDEFDSQTPILVTVNQDRVFEGDENFLVNLSSDQGTLARGTATGSILEPLEVASSRDANGQGVVNVFDYRTGLSRFSINPYPGFLGEIRVATGDFNGDGITDIVTAPGPGGGPHIKALNGIDGSTLFEFNAYASGFVGGVFVAAGDVNNDGRDDIITGPDVGGGPHVRVFDGTSANVIEEFIAMGLGASFTGGIRVAAGNTDGVGGDDIILGYGPGSEPRVEVYTAEGDIGSLPTLVNAFNAYNPLFGGGVYVSAADIGGGAAGAPDGFLDIITGPGAGGGPHVLVYSSDSPTTDANTSPAVLESFFAYAAGFAGGVRVASGDVSDDLGGNASRDRLPEIITSPGPGGGPHVRAFSVDGNPGTAAIPFINNRFPFATNLTSGVYVSGRTRGFVFEGSPLLLDGQAAPDANVDALTQQQLQPVVEAALARLRNAGIAETAIGQLRQLQFTIADLDGNVLGRQLAGQILIDRTAAGRGYFIDLTPGEDEEFAWENGRLLASDIAAQGRVDLLTVVLHELGHALGEDHADGHGLLAPTLSTGERRLPEFDEVFADGDIFHSLLNLS